MSEAATVLFQDFETWSTPQGHVDMRVGPLLRDALLQTLRDENVTHVTTVEDLQKYAHTSSSKLSEPPSCSIRCSPHGPQAVGLKSWVSLTGSIAGSKPSSNGGFHIA